MSGQVLSSISAVRIQGVGGRVNDTLTIDFSGGMFAPPQDIQYDGGRGGFDALVLTGGDATHACNAHNGTITLDATRIVYSNIEPVNDDTVSATDLTFTATSATETINIVDGPLVGSVQTTQINSGTSNTFELINYANKINVTVNGGAGNDTITRNVNTCAAGLSNLTVNGNGDGGDTLSIVKFSGASVNLTGTGINTLTQSGPITASAIVIVATGTIQLATITAVSLEVTTNGALSFNQSATATYFMGLSAGGIVQTGAAPLSTNNLLVLGPAPPS